MNQPVIQPTVQPLTGQGSREQGAIEQFATFRVGQLFMGIALSQVQELMRCQEMATVPLAPAAVRGLINLRGQIVTALDMRRILGLPPLAPDSPPPMNIVVDCDGGPVSLLVDEICDVIDVPLSASAHASTRLPEHLPQEQRALLKGVYQLPSSLLLVLDTEQAISAGALS